MRTKDPLKKRPKILEFNAHFILLCPECFWGVLQEISNRRPIMWSCPNCHYRIEKDDYEQLLSDYLSDTH